MSQQNQRLLEGEVVDANGDANEVARLREVNRTLMRELNDVHEENEQLRKRVAVAGAPIARLRKNLEPFYKLMQTIFGDINEIDPGDSPSTSSVSGMNDRVLAVWKSWQQKMPGVTANIIGALLDHGSANATQLKVMCKHDIKTIYNAIARLKTVGLVTKGGDGKYSLKQL